MNKDELPTWNWSRNKYGKLVSRIQFKVRTVHCIMSFAAENDVGNIVDRRFYPKVFEGIRF